MSSRLSAPLCVSLGSVAERRFVVWVDGTVVGSLFVKKCVETAALSRVPVVVLVVGTAVRV